MAHSYSFDEIKDRPVAVIGGGTLGKRIAMMFASRGGTSRIHDPNHAQAEAAVEYVAQTLPGVIDKRGSGAVGHAVAAPSLEDSLADAWLVVEAVPERLDIKIPLWGEIDRLAPNDAIFATNSSSFPSQDAIRS